MNTASILMGAKNKTGKIVLTGMKSVDDSMGGLRSGNVYALAGLEKSGKTSLLLNWISNMLKSQKKIAYVSTEMEHEEIVTRLASIRGVKLNNENTEEKKDLFQSVENNFMYVGIEELLDDKEKRLSADKTEAIVEKKIWEGAEIVILDNMTTFGTQSDGGKESTWWKIGTVIGKMKVLSNKLNVPIIIVLHIKPSTTFKESPMGINKLIKLGRETEIFNESITIISKPSLVDVYGGGGSLSQLSGCILLWRPFQKFAISKYQGESALILDSMRYSRSGVQIRLNFDGSTGKFYEQMTNEEYEEMEQLLKENGI